MVQLDYEQALDYDPDLVLCVGATSAEEHQKLMETAFAENEEYWDSIPAIADGRVLYLPVSYVSTAGINVVDCINDLIRIGADYYGVEVETQAIEPLLADETEDESDAESDAAETESAEDEAAAETEETKE